jgi:hypothetical protein
MGDASLKRALTAPFVLCLTDCRSAAWCLTSGMFEFIFMHVKNVMFLAPCGAGNMFSFGRMYCLCHGIRTQKKTPDVAPRLYK